MKKKLLLAIISLFCLISEVISQTKFTASSVNNQSVTSLGSHFSGYSVFSINTAAIYSYSKQQTGKKINFELQLPGLASWKFNIAEHDILDKNYILVINGPNGKTVLPKPDCMTYSGYLEGNNDSRVSLTINDGIIYGMIKQGGKDYFIEPLRYFDKQADPSMYVVYDVKDVKPDMSLTCGVTELTQRTITQRTSSGTNCIKTELAIASDESMFLRYGSAGAVQTHNIGVMNNVIWDYVNAQFTDNIEFSIVTQNVSTSAAADQLSPLYTGTNSNTVLANFRTWGQAGNFGVTYDDAQFWTTRNIDADGAGGSSGIVGLAYVGAVCSSFRYHILEDFAGSNPTGSGYQLRVLTSHEIGHNFNCSHDASGSPYIMAPSVGNTSTWSAASIASVDGFTPGAACLTACSPAAPPVVSFITLPGAICTGGTLQLKDHSLGGPTSWSWTMTGGTPATSSVRNPTVTYGTNGIKNISLISTNGSGPGTAYSKNVLVSSSAATACINSGPNGSDAGIKSFSLNNISKITGSAAVDGDRYMDFSCTDNTILSPSTTYSATVNVGYLSPTDPTPPNVFNHVLFYIDYNNDGDFIDAGENVYSSGGSAYIGNVSFSFTTPSSPMTDQLLRARIIARDFGGSISSCHNPSAGQIEDYAVFFPSNILLPVNLFSFDGYYQSGNTFLNWQTSGEKDNSYFEIERSTDGTNFSRAGRTDASPNSSSRVSYNYTDPVASLSGIIRIFYRLKIVDLSGSFTYSKIVPVTIKSQKNDLLLTLYPNPFIDDISAVIQLSRPNNTVVMQLTDIAGKTIYNQSRNFPAGIHTLTYNDFKNLAKGTYILKLTCDNEIVSRLIEKQ